MTIDEARAEVARARAALGEARQAEQELCRIRLNAEAELRRAQDELARLKSGDRETRARQNELDALTAALAAAQA